VRTLIKRDFETVFGEGVDAILTPATPSAAFGVADQDMASDPVKMYLNDIFTVTVNMAGLPGIAVPAGLNDAGLPLGLQLIGKPFDEATLLRGHARRFWRGQALYRDSDSKNIKAPLADLPTISRGCPRINKSGPGCWNECPAVLPYCLE
jgi:hypothetical protein